MKKPSEPMPPEVLRDRLIGLGERSFRKSYYPALQERLDQLERFRTLLDHAGDMILLAHLDTRRIIDANASASRQLLYPGLELVGKSIEEVVAMDRLEWPEPSGEGVDRLVSTVLHRNDGSDIPVEMILSLDAFAGSDYVVVVARDISERLRSEAELRRSEWEKTIILESTEELVIFHDSSMRITWANSAAARVLKMTGEEVKGHYCWEFWHHNGNPCTDCPVIRAIRTGHPQKAEITGPDGRVWFIRGYPARNAAGDIEGGVELCLDITERKRADQALLESEERFRSIFQHSAAGMVTFSLDGKMLQVNPALCRLLGYTEDELLQMTVEEITHPEDREIMRQHYDRVRRGEAQAFTYEKRYLRKDDSFIWGHATIACIRPWGTPPYCVGMMQDISDRKRVEEALLESDRMKTEFISTAAHELRTPLTSILGFSEVLAGEDQLSSAERKEFLSYINRQARGLAELVTDLLDIARIESGQGLALKLEPCTASELVTCISPIVQSGALRDRFTLEIGSGEAPLIADRGKIGQVFENLLSNALKYSPSGSPIRVSGKMESPDYLFCVSDLGIGMTQEQVARVFDKFYRGDASDTAVGGLGLGMSIVRNIVEAHGGRIRVESEPGRGTDVFFTLPLREEEGRSL